MASQMITQTDTTVVSLVREEGQTELASNRVDRGLCKMGHSCLLVGHGQRCVVSLSGPLKVLGPVRKIPLGSTKAVSQF